MDIINRGKDGITVPLCTNCQSPDCTHKIHNIQVSTLGIKSHQRLLVKGSGIYSVVQCDGYVQPDIKEKDEQIDLQIL